MTDFISPVRCMVTIVDRGKGDRVVDLCRARHVAVQLVMLGHGTASAEVMDYLGLDEPEKDIVLSLVPGALVAPLLADLTLALGFSRPGKGIAFTVPLSGISAAANRQTDGGRVRAEINVEREVPPMTENNQFELIISVVEHGMADDVMAAAKTAGARGGTVARARGLSSEEAEKFLHITIQPEKDVVLILTAAAQKQSIMKAICNEAFARTGERGIAVSVPVTAVTGLDQARRAGPAAERRAPIPRSGGCFPSLRTNSQEPSRQCVPGRLFFCHLARSHAPAEGQARAGRCSRSVCKRLAPLQPHQRQRAEAQIDRNGGKRRFHAEITARYQRRSGVQHIIEQRISVGLRADVQHAADHYHIPYGVHGCAAPHRAALISHQREQQAHRSARRKKLQYARKAQLPPQDVQQGKRQGGAEHRSRFVPAALNGRHQNAAEHGLLDDARARAEEKYRARRHRRGVLRRPSLPMSRLTQQRARRQRGHQHRARRPDRAQPHWCKTAFLRRHAQALSAQQQKPRHPQRRIQHAGQYIAQPHRCAHHQRQACQKLRAQLRRRQNHQRQKPQRRPPV